MTNVNYKLVADRDGSLLNIVQRLPDTTFIPFASGNTDYQKYLEWVESGNTPLPADE